MSCRMQADGTIELYFYGELDAVARGGVQSHLRSCAECRRALDDLSLIRAALASRPDIATPPGGDWSGFMGRVEREVQGLVDAERSGPGRGRRAQAPLSVGRVGPWLAMAALLALVTVAVLFVLRERSLPPEGLAETAADQGASQSVVRAAPDPALMSVSGQHFERSKLVVLGLATKDPSTAADGSWTYERDLAGTLLGDTRLYRRAAEQRGMEALAGVMRDLELVLLQTSMSAEPDAASLEQLQRLIRRRDLLAKMNVAYTGGH